MQESAAQAEGEGERKAGLDPSSFSLVEAAQYGNLERLVQVLWE